MRKVAVVLRRAPYGDINAAEAVRHAMGGISVEFSVDLILVDGGVLLAKKNQEITDSGFTNLGEALKDCLDMGVAVCADKASLREHHLEASDLVDGVKLANAAEIAEIVQEAKTTMIF